MSEFTSYSQYYDNGNFRANKRWQKDFGNFGQVKLEIPDYILERKNTNESFKKYGISLEFGRWEGYFPEPQLNLDSEVMIARSPLYPLQRIVGPKYFIHNIMFAYYLLDMLYPNNPFHNMDLVASVSFNEKGNIRNPNKLLWTKSFLDTVGIDVLPSKFSEMDENNPEVGMTIDVIWPTFYMYYDLRIGSGKSHTITSIIQAEAIVHDWTHFEQERLGFSSVCTEAERQAVSNQLRFAEAIYNHPGFFKPDVCENWRPERITPNYADSIRQLISTLESFKSGGYGHLEESCKDISWYEKNRPTNYLPIVDFR